MANWENNPRFHSETDARHTSTVRLHTSPVCFLGIFVALSITMFFTHPCVCCRALSCLNLLYTFTCYTRHRPRVDTALDPTLLFPWLMPAHVVLLVSSVYVWSRSLSLYWAGLWSAAKTVVWRFAKDVLPRSISITILTSTALRTLRWLVAFPDQVGRYHFLGATFLGSQGNWLWGLASPRIYASPPIL